EFDRKVINRLRRRAKRVPPKRFASLVSRWRKGIKESIADGNFYIAFMRLRALGLFMTVHGVGVSANMNRQEQVLGNKYNLKAEQEFVDETRYDLALIRFVVEPEDLSESEIEEGIFFRGAVEQREAA